MSFADPIRFSSSVRSRYPSPLSPGGSAFCAVSSRSRSESTPENVICQTLTECLARRLEGNTADDMDEVLENHPFHPADPPHGLRNFDLGALSKDQQRSLNEAKIRRRVENEIYLKAHPEVRGLISILLRHLLLEKPMQDVHETVGSFFTRPRDELIADLLDYFTDTGHSSGIVEDLRNEIAKQALQSINYIPSDCPSSRSSSESTT